MLNIPSDQSHSLTERNRRQESIHHSDPSPARFDYSVFVMVMEKRNRAAYRSKQSFLGALAAPFRALGKNFKPPRAAHGTVFPRLIYFIRAISL
jgi:hypothetical protein